MSKKKHLTPLETRSRKLSAERVAGVLEDCRSKKIWQTELAKRLGIPKQYLTDYKKNRRTIGESVARRWEDAFGVNWQWLTGRSNEKEPEAVQIAGAAKRSNGVWLPIFDHPIEGEPRDQPKWAGITAEVVGAAATKAKHGALPYLLKFGANDHQQILQKGDLLLMSQAAVVTHSRIEEVVHVIQYGRGMYLVRRTSRGWQRLASAYSRHLIPFDRCTVCGHVLAIVYRSLI
jgi:transcriptional regulator with XRE-family HTH domain